MNFSVAITETDTVEVITELLLKHGYKLSELLFTNDPRYMVVRIKTKFMHPSGIPHRFNFQLKDVEDVLLLADLSVDPYAINSMYGEPL